MVSMVLDPGTAAALELLGAGVDAVVAAGVAPVDGPDAVVVVRELEVLVRRLRAQQVAVVEAIDRGGLHRVDGHGSAKVMVRHVARLSSGEAHRRASAARALRDLPAVAEAFRAGRIGSCQVERIARVHANERVRCALVDNEGSFAREAAMVSFRLFDLMVTNWVRLVDEDGTCDANERRHENRDASFVQDFDGSWTFRGGCASLSGAEVAEIFKRFVEAETLADWEKARAEHGDAATVADLGRTDNQRRFDALFQIFQRAASDQAAHGGSVVVTNIVIDHVTFERLCRQFAGATVEPPDPGFGPGAGRGSGDGFRCSTLDGRPVGATDAVANALVGHVRRVVVGADSVVIDLGRRRRLFTGAAQLAVQLSAAECYWPGCHVPVSDCQTDHLIPWADHKGGGSTNPGNGGPACGRHNRFKEHGYRVWRDGAGTWHTHRPDGTEIS
ncbi:MAG: HNH endonuclease signature motif containing protein [Mycobacteriaceae bacterium]